MGSSKLPANLSPEEKRAMLAALLRRKAGAAVTESPLSYGQRALWFIYQLDPSSSAYNVSLSMRLRGRVDSDALRQAIAGLFRRHGSLRTTFRAQGGEPLQVVRGYIETPFETIDAAGYTDEQLHERVLSVHRCPFDLETGPACRAALVTTRDDHHVLLLGAHHAIVDGRSLGVLLEELIQSYMAMIAGAEITLPPVACEYTAFAHWQSRMLEEQGDTLEAFWRETLAAPLPVLELPGDRPRPAVESFRGEAITFVLPPTLRPRLKEVARTEGVTLFGLLVAAYFVLLHRYSGQDDLVIGSPAIGRSRAEFERVVGYFVNPIAIRMNLAGNPTFKELLARVRTVVQRALAHQDYPFPLLVERLQPERTSNRPPVFQVMFNLMRTDWQPSAQGKTPLTLESYAIPQEEGQFDLALDVAESGNDLVGMLRYSSDLFDRQTIERMLQHYRALLAAIVRSTDLPLSELSQLSDEEQSLLRRWNATEMAYDAEDGVEGMFAAQARRVPDAVAVEGTGATRRYRELDDASNRLAWRLQAAGVGPDTLVGVCLQRTPDMLVALLGILKAGGAYVPLDPAFPRQRLTLMAEDAQLRLILTDAATRELVPQIGADLLLVADAGTGQPATPPVPRARGEHLAYVLYTSGSTGKPKGVQISRRAFANFIRAMQQQPGLSDRDVMLALTTLSFDIAGLELFLPLSVGARIVLATREQATDGAALRTLIASSGVTVMQATPATFRMLLTAGWTGHAALRLLCGGEPLPADLAAELRRQGAALWNMYGPTETTVWSTLADVTSPTTPITIGRPIGNTRVYVLDARRQHVPIGVWGELWIGGDGVARGYLGRADLTRERFLEDPFHTGGRMYRTGDRARFRPDGTLECQGRLDFQVKVRGFRIELEEIETALREQPGVLEAVVVVDGTGDRARLLGGVRLAPDAALDAPGRRDQLRARLPDYMIPAALLAVETWPLTPNQKIDRPRVQTLLAAAATERGSEAAAAPPVTPTEQALAALWADLLRVATISRTDNFFVLGGHSLLATQLVARIREHFDVDVPLRRVFETTTLQAAAADIDDRLGRSAAAPRRPDLVPVSRTTPLRASHTQERLWFIQQLFPESAAYHIPVVLRLDGSLDVAALQRGWATLVERHEGLRTRFTVDGDHVIQHTDARPALTTEAVTADDTAARDAEVQRRCDALVRTPFDLTRGPLVRAVLLVLPDAHVLVLVSHHIVSDQWSLGVVLRELIALYREAIGGPAAALPALPVQYADYASWERRSLDEPAAQAGYAYWTQQLSGVPVLELPTDHPRPSSPSMRGAVLAFPLDAVLSNRGRALAVAEGVTLATCLTATFVVLLGRYTGQRDLPLGIAVANRDHSHLTNVVGAFINTLVLRLQLDPGATFRELMTHVQAVSLDAYAHQQIPFDHLVATLQTSRDLSRPSLVQVMFNVLNTPTHDIEWPGLRWAPLMVDRGGAQLDLSVHVDAEVTHTIAVEYNSDVFDAETIRRFAGHYIQLLSTFVSAPERSIDHAPLLTATERAQLETWNATEMLFDGDEGAEAMFAAQAARTPTAIAVETAAATVRYGELDAAANRLASHLRERGVGPETLVGVCVERSPDMLVALLGVLKAGGAYVPLDPGFPPQRLALMAEDAQLRLILIDEASRTAAPDTGAELLLVSAAVAASAAAAPPPPLARGSHLAYVLYTSGSTGRPKGVQVTRRAFTNFIRAMQQQPGLSDGDVVLALTTLSFDIAGLELFLPLSVGAKIVLATRDEASDASALGATIADRAVTVMQATPATWRMLLAAGWNGHRGLRMLCGGEALPSDLATELRRQGAELWNLYGPTETTVWSTLADVTAPDAPIVIGRPIANTRVYVLDERRQLLPAGVWGELWIGGDGVARGYLGRADLTRERFLEDPFHTGGRMYRTGDRARFRPDGTLECQGRLDFQVKVRGFRIELEEIETALREQPGVLEAVVVVDGTGDRARLLGGVRLAPDAALDAPGRRDQLRARLPDYMIPAALLAVETWPLTPNQKIDRPRVQTLLAAAATERGSEAAAAPPVTPTEQALAALWADLLRVATISRTDNFFVLGGHSLLATQLVARIREHFDVDVPLRRVFETTTLETIAADIDERRGQRGAVSRRPDLMPVSRTAPLRASHTQERLWFIQQLFPESAAYHIPVILRLDGTLNAAALHRSWNALAERHEGLRTRFTVDGDHVIQHTDAQPPLTTQVLTTTDSAEAEAEVQHLCNGLARAPFDLARGPLVRAVLIATPDAHVLVLVSHHIVSDQWSLGVVLRELIALYREATGGPAAALPPLPVQYADYAAWERRCLEAPTAEAALAYWTQQLDGLPVLDFPGDHPRPPSPSMRGAVLTVPLDAALCTRGRTLAVTEGVTLATCLTATFAVLLGRYTGQHDLPVGIAVANRDHSHLTNVIGAFINTLVLRLQLTSGATFRGLLARVQAVSLDAYAHQEIPFDHLVATLQASRDLSRSPLVQVMFNVLNTPTHGVEWPGLRWTPLLVDRGGAQLDLSVYVDTDVTHTMAIEYNTDVFDAETIRRFAGHYVQLLSTFVNAPEQAIDHAPLLTATEHAQLEKWNATEMAYDAEDGVEGMFAAQARRVPDAVAVEGTGATRRYRELDDASNRLAWRLQAAGVGPDTLVGVCLQRTPDMLVALLGILKAGGAYVPLDPAFPRQRLTLMAEDAQLRLILTDAATRELVPQIGADLLLVADAGTGQPATPPVPRARGEHLAYVLYTSGSTGKPKGVQISRRAFANFIRAMQQQPGLSDRDVMLALTTLSFDIAGLELFLPLSVGARIVLATREQATDGAALRTLIASSGVTVMQATPATFRMLLTAGWTGHAALRLLCGGEPLPADLAAELRRQGAALWNMYGPTETTVWSTLADVTSPTTPITIGRPIGNTRVYVLDARRQHVPIGVWGELWIGGDGVARGYLGRADLTRERFLEDPFHTGGRMYRTGDRARFRPDGTLECQGRLDFQVKVRGFRIELEEIETALREQPGVLEAVVVVDGTGDRARLLGGVRLAPDAALDAPGRRDQLRARLPDYMIPAALLAVETWPLTPNQKIDRPRVQTLLAAAATERGSEAAAAPPVTPTEQALAALWADLLRVATISRTDNFFVLGGHSLLATQLVARIREHFDVDVPLRVIFEYDTLTALAARIDALVLILQLTESTMATAEESREEIQL